VKWRVTRQPVYPWWWCGGTRRPRTRRTIATGVTALKEDGSFQLTFTPEADEKQTSREVSYRYLASADVTDEGGETRSGVARVPAPASCRVEGGSTPASRSNREGEKAEATFARTDLDGVPRPARRAGGS